MSDVSHPVIQVMFTKILCALSTEIDIPTVKYLARYTGLNKVFD